jgi:hypothetical protein
MVEKGHARRIALIGETMADVRKVMIEGESVFWLSALHSSGLNMNPPTASCVGPTVRLPPVIRGMNLTNYADRSTILLGPMSRRNGTTRQRPGTTWSWGYDWEQSRGFPRKRVRRTLRRNIFCRWLGLKWCSILCCPEDLKRRRIRRSRRVRRSGLTCRAAPAERRRSSEFRKAQRFGCA